jgi:hypothetical protein
VKIFYLNVNYYGKHYLLWSKPLPYGTAYENIRFLLLYVGFSLFLKTYYDRYPLDLHFPLSFPERE